MPTRLDPSKINDPSIPQKCIIHREKIDELQKKIDLFANTDNYRHEEVEKLCSKIDQTMEKLQELTLSITQMVALHDGRIQHVEQSADTMSKLFALQTEKCIENDTITRQNLTNINILTDKLCKLEKRISVFEIWRWTITGAGVLILWGLSQLPHIIDYFQTLS